MKILLLTAPKTRQSLGKDYLIWDKLQLSDGAIPASEPKAWRAGERLPRIC
jgi:hypothetical protein